MNYILTIEVDNGVLMAKVFKSLPHEGEQVSLVSVENGREPAAPAPILGGIGDETPVDSEIQEIANSVKGQVEKQLGVTFEKFVVVSYTQQVVAGTNYIMKIEVEGGFISVKAYKPLPYEGEQVSLVFVKDDREPVAPARILGGFGDENPADVKIQEIAYSVKGQVEEQLGATFSKFNVVTYAQQVVAGTNYIMKIEVDDGYIHVKAFESLPHEGSTVNLTFVEYVNEPLAADQDIIGMPATDENPIGMPAQPSATDENPIGMPAPEWATDENPIGMPAPEWATDSNPIGMPAPEWATDSNPIGMIGPEWTFDSNPIGVPAPPSVTDNVPIGMPAPTDLQDMANPESSAEEPGFLAPQTLDLELTATLATNLVAEVAFDDKTCPCEEFCSRFDISTCVNSCRERMCHLPPIGSSSGTWWTLAVEWTLLLAAITALIFGLRWYKGVTTIADPSYKEYFNLNR